MPEETDTPETSLTNWIRALNVDFRQITGLEPAPKEPQDLILKAYEDWVEYASPARVRAFHAAKPFLRDRIVQRAKRDGFWSQPIVLCVYLWIDRAPSMTKEKWPLLPKELEPFFVDLGYAFSAD